MKKLAEVTANGRTGAREIMAAKEVAEFLDLHLLTVHKLAREGRLPAFKVGRDWRFRRSSIEDWIRQEENQRRRT